MLDLRQCFTEAELNKLALNLSRTRGAATEEEASLLFRRLAEMSVHGELVQLAIDGEVDIEWSPEKQDVVFSKSPLATTVHWTMRRPEG